MSKKAAIASDDRWTIGRRRVAFFLSIFSWLCFFIAVWVYLEIDENPDYDKEAKW